MFSGTSFAPFRPQFLTSTLELSDDTVPYQLSLAVPAGAQNYVNFDVPAINPLITNWHLMAYDYAGSWSSVSDYLANLYRGNTKQGVDTDSTLKWYTNQGATKHKITMG